jgi:heme oxygenase (biliverdin-IX-beta and delta-forming)
MLSTNIKEATKSAHQQLEKQVVLRMKAIRSNEDYAEFLKCFYAYFSTLEKAIAPYITSEVLPDYAERRHASFLKSDIEALGGSVDRLPIATVPVITNSLQAMGALYVMEGSIMGGSIIVQMLAKFGITKGVSFFSGYGETTHAMWGKFITALNAQAITADDEAVAITTADETFNHFGYVFENSRELA